LTNFADNHVFSGNMIITKQAISNETCIRIANILATNHPHILALNLSENEKLSVDGGVALGEALKKNKTLKQLNLKGTDLGKDGTNRIMEALRYNSTLEELELGLVSSSNLEYLNKLIGENNTLNWLSFEEAPNHLWSEHVKQEFLKALRAKDNARLLSINIKTDHVIKHEIFLGQVAKICEFNRKNYLEELENSVNEKECNQESYYATEMDIIKSEIFSIKSYLTNIFGTILEEGLYQLDKERVDMIRDNELAKIEGKPIVNQNANLLTADGSIFELAKYLLKKVDHK